MRPIPRYRYRSIGAVPDLEQKQAWQLFVQEKGMHTQNGRSIVPGAFMAIFLYQMPTSAGAGSLRE